MKSLLNRRSFLKGSARTASLLGLGGLGTLAIPNAGSACAAPATPEPIPLHPDIEPLARLIRETPRERIVAVMIEQVRRGLSYRRFLATNFLAGIRYDLSGQHGVYVTHAVNQVGLDVPREDQFLPLFYHLGVLKSQDRTPYLRRVPDADLPGPRQAEGVFQAAMAER